MSIFSAYNPSLGIFIESLREWLGRKKGCPFLLVQPPSDRLSPTPVLLLKYDPALACGLRVEILELAVYKIVPVFFAAFNTISSTAFGSARLYSRGTYGRGYSGPQF
jgi:hypothetical protein